MHAFNRLLSTAAIGLAVGLTSFAAVAETPANMLVIANRIDDITTIDPAQSFEFAGSDVSRNIYNKLVSPSLRTMVIIFQLPNNQNQ